jgi:hypothetical protein
MCGTTLSSNDKTLELGVLETASSFLLQDEECCCGFEHLGNHSNVSIVRHTPCPGLRNPLGKGNYYGSSK